MHERVAPPVPVHIKIRGAAAHPLHQFDNFGSPKKCHSAHEKVVVNQGDPPTMIMLGCGYSAALWRPGNTLFHTLTNAIRAASLELVC
jgi:hypothetical protein